MGDNGVVMNAAFTATNTDPELIRLFEDELAPLEEDEAAAIGSHRAEWLAEIRTGMAAIKSRINARLAELALPPLFEL